MRNRMKTDAMLASLVPTLLTLLIATAQAAPLTDAAHYFVPRDATDHFPKDKKPWGHPLQMNFLVCSDKRYERCDSPLVIDGQCAKVGHIIIPTYLSFQKRRSLRYLLTKFR
jgi:hypothetical protein